MKNLLMVALFTMIIVCLVAEDTYSDSLLIAARAGNAEAQYKLGDCYYYSRGVTENDTEAIYWYRLAAQHGLAQAQSIMGELYAKGRLVPQSYTDSVYWYKLAAEQGDNWSLLKLGDYSFYGQGVVQNYNEAVAWYRILLNRDIQKPGNWRLFLWWSVYNRIILRLYAV